MKNFKDRSIQLKLPVLIGASSLTVMAFICALLVFPLRSGSLEDSSKIARLSAEVIGERLAERINGTANVIRAYAGVISQLSESENVTPDNRRQLLMAQLKALGENERAMCNVWCILEPNVLDGMDAQYIDRTGSNADGRFTPRIVNGRLFNVDHLINTDSYIIPKTTGREMVSEPYEDEIAGAKVQMFSITVPINSNGKFLGVLGADFYAKELSEIIERLSHNAVGRLVSSNGIVAVHYDPTRFGKIAEQGNRDILDRLPDGKMFSGMYMYEGREVYKAYFPIQLGAGTPPWFYAVDVSKEDIYANAKKTEIYLIVLCIIGAVLIALAGLLLIRTLLKNISQVTGIIRQLSSGRISLHIDEHRNRDEIGVMKEELRRLVEGLKHTADFAKNIGEGKLDAEYRLLSDDDALGASLLEMRKSLQIAEKEHSDRARIEEQCSWGSSGLAKFSEILRKNNDNIETLSYNIISNMVKYLNVNQGGLFVLNEAEREEDKILEMTACYAFDRKKFAEKHIRPGEGLVGTCFLEGEMIYLTDVPDNYITITSGLGDANPSAVLICPLKVNDEVFGVVELASFHPLEPHQLDFVQKVSESIAATISSVRVNIRTERLLAQTQLQTEEMANQEEELRQNMEEMQATQEDMRRREIELNETLSKMQEMQTAAEEKEYEMQQFHQTIFEVCNVVEFSAEGVITNVNQNLLNIFNKADRNTFVGKRSAAFIGPGLRTLAMQLRI